MTRAAKRHPAAQYFHNIYTTLYTIGLGLWVTFRQFIRFSPTTVIYPYEKRELPERFRGTLFMDAKLCIACDACAKICPVDCIDIIAEGKGKERHPALFDINFYKCMWCGLCTEVCPTECIYMTQDVETVFYDRQQMIVHFVPQLPMPKTLGYNAPRPGQAPKRERAATDKSAAPKPAASAPANLETAEAKPAETKPAIPAEPATPAEPAAVAINQSQENQSAKVEPAVVDPPSAEPAPPAAETNQKEE